MAKIGPVLRLSMSGIGQGPDRGLEADRVQAAIEMAEYADSHGFAIVNVEENHDVEIGWLSSVVQREMSLWFIDEDPDEAWATLGPYFLRESKQYSSWRRSGVTRVFSNPSDSIDALRETGVYEVLTPDQALARMREATADYMPIVQPLTGGSPLERAWRCMELFGEVISKIGQL